VIASDGELYGHHQQLRDYFLAHLVNGASSSMGLKPTYLALWLREHPPRRSIQIRERTSWSCFHGVSRWAANCGCVPGDQAWKSHLRNAFDHLAQRLDGLYVGALNTIVPDVWTLRDRYIRVQLGQQRMDELLAELAGKRLPIDTVMRAQFHLEAQLMRQRMYASCGWFFDDFDRIEPRNSVAYAAQAVRLVQVASGIDLARQLLAELRLVVSPRTGLRGDQVLAGHLNRASYMP